VPSLSPWCGLLTALVVLNSVAGWCNTTQFLQKWYNFTCLCAWASEGFFPGGRYWIFSKSFSRGAKSGEIRFLPLETKKTAFFAEIFKFLPPFRHPCLCVGKVRVTPLKHWCNLKRFNTILKSEILLNLIHKMKYFTDQFQLCLWFCTGNTKQLYLFRH